MMKTTAKNLIFDIKIRHRKLYLDRVKPYRENTIQESVAITEELNIPTTKATSENPLQALDVAIYYLRQISGNRNAYEQLNPSELFVSDVLITEIFSQLHTRNNSSQFLQ